MNRFEMSNEMDVLLSAYTLDVAIVLDEYEKSVYLTKAQEDIVLEIYNGRNNLGISFESNEEARRFLVEAVKEFNNEITTPAKEANITLPLDVWFITYEECTLSDTTLGCKDGKTALITPIRQDELYKVLKNPFKGPSDNRVLRIDINDSIRLISKYNMSKYHCFYLSKPTPIILVDIGDLEIDGYSTAMDCMLDDSLHNMIVERAVRLALSSKAQYANKENNNQ